MTNFIELLEEMLNAGENTTEGVIKELNELIKLLEAAPEEVKINATINLRAFIAGTKITILYPNVVRQDMPLLKDLASEELKKA